MNQLQGTCYDSNYRQSNENSRNNIQYLHAVQSIPGLQAAQNAAAGQQQNVVMVQPQSNLASVTSSPVSSNAQNAIVQNAANGIQTMQNASDNQPITITNAQGQQITVIPTQALQQLRPANANIIQMPNVSGLQTIPVQNIPGLGNVQVSICYKNII